LSKIPKDIGCENTVCVEAEKCQRQVIYANGTAREVKKFGGNPDKGCGKFLPLEKKS
jgi:hypothetical protein